MTPTPTPPRWSALAPAEFIVLAAIWGASFLFMRVAVVELGALPAAGVRVSIAAVFLLPLLAVGGRWTVLRQRPGPLLTVGLLNSGVPFALIAYALQTLSTGLSAIINAMVPTFGALVAWGWLREPPTRQQGLGLLLGFVGVALLAGDGAGFRTGTSAAEQTMAVGASLAACLCYGLAASYTRRHLTGVPSLVIATGSQVGASLGLIVPTVLLWPSQTPSLQAWLALLAAGTLCTGVAFILYFRLIERVGAARSLTVTFLIPVFALGYGTALLGERITVWMVGCAVVVLLGTALSMNLLRRR